VFQPSQTNPSQHRRPWAWIPTLYLAEGLPNALVTTVALLLYKALGVSNTKVAFYTGLFYLPWVLKPLWSPLVDLLRTRRLWIWRTQILLSVAAGALACLLPASWFVPGSIVCFFLLAFSSATHDIAADGFYILALSEQEQSFFVGVRNAVYRLATLSMKGPFIFLVAALQAELGNVRTAWMIAFAGLAILFAALGIYHRSILPRSAADREGSWEGSTRFWRDFVETFRSFFGKRRIGVLLSFLLLYRFAEAQLLPMAQAFLIDSNESGGLGLSNRAFSMVYGTGGVIALMTGGLLGGWVVSRFGLRRCLWPMAFATHAPNALFVYLAYALPSSTGVVAACVAAEQFGYGFGFTAYMLYMIHIARGQHQTAHYAICTGFMALGLMLPGMWSGWLQDLLGYPRFFMWVLIATLPGFIVTALIPVQEGFGRKQDTR